MNFRIVLTYTLNLFFGLLYPTVKSIEAVESYDTGHDDAQWLMYWIIYTLLLITETLLWPALKWIPLYSEAKAVLLAWLVLPHFKGATWVYENIIGPGWTKARAEATKIPALERLLNPDDAAAAKTWSAEDDANFAETRKDKVTLTLQEVRDALLDKLDNIKGMTDVKAKRKAERAFDKDLTRVEKLGGSKTA